MGTVASSTTVGAVPVAAKAAAALPMSAERAPERGGDHVREVAGDHAGATAEFLAERGGEEVKGKRDLAGEDDARGVHHGDHGGQAEAEVASDLLPDLDGEHVPVASGPMDQFRGDGPLLFLPLGEEALRSHLE